MLEFFAGYLMGRSQSDSAPPAAPYRLRPSTRVERDAQERRVRNLSLVAGVVTLVFFLTGGLSSCVQRVTGAPEDCGKGSAMISILKQVSTPECRR